jgi:predicted nucleic acid-binding protein
MNEAQLVIIDTCIWANYFGKPTSPSAAAVKSLIRRDQAAILGPVASELLIGFRREDQARWVASRLAGVRQLALTWQDWIDTASLGRIMRSRGHHLPLTDLVIGARAARLQCSVMTTDPHFELIPDLRRHVW